VRNKPAVAIVVHLWRYCKWSLVHGVRESARKLRNQSFITVQGSIEQTDIGKRMNQGDGEGQQRNAQGAGEEEVLGHAPVALHPRVEIGPVIFWPRASRASTDRYPLRKCFAAGRVIPLDVRDEAGVPTAGSSGRSLSA
jgi:hypothetical protein